MSVPNTFASATSSIPLANLDANFAYYDAAFAISGSAVTFAGSITLTTGTANGVPYLNASKVLTSGAVLTFDGTTLSSTKFAGALNGTVGATTANTGAFTTLSADKGSTGTVATFKGGTKTAFIYSDNSYLALTDAASAGGTGILINSSTPTVYQQISGSLVTAVTSTGLAVTGTLSATGATAAAYLVLNAPTDGGYASFQVGAATFADVGSFKGIIGTGSASDLYIGTRSTNNLTFGTAFVERMRLDSSGNLGIGTSSPAYKLDVDSTGGTVASLNSTNANGPGLRFARSGTANGYVGSAKYIVNGALADFGIDVSGANNLIFGTNDTERMRLDSSGNLGIGTTSPDCRLMLETPSGTACQLNLSQSAVTNYRLSIPASTDALTFVYGASTERMRLDSSGNLLVGATTSVASKILSSFTGTAVDGYTSIDTTDTNGAYFFVCRNSATTTIGSISRNGASAVSYNTSSDYRLKNITGPITTSGAYIDSLNPVEGTWKTDGSTFVGLIAHEVQEASRTTVATGTKDGEDMQGMDYSSAEIIANLIAELQSLRARVAQLESKP